MEYFKKTINLLKSISATNGIFQKTINLLKSISAKKISNTIIEKPPNPIAPQMDHPPKSQYI
jgi:hypothetical protein